uniref:Queuosine 5'-phosphate N-glycosylase/hydrolase n=1 Tax=Panagrolaimus sp. ES5 TaxID=591445 RepID=A0AC34F659_9BILA
METFCDISGAIEILKFAEYVSLSNEENFEKAGKELKALARIPDPPQLANQLLSPPESLSEEDAFNWFFLMDLINFHFYYKDGQQYTVTFKDQKFVGSMGLAAAINRWLEVNPDAVKPETLANITKEELQKYFVDDSGMDIPMIDERFAFIKSTYPLLIKKNQSFLDAIISLEFSPKNILAYLQLNFPCFCDESDYNGHKIQFHKRAQLLIKDILTNCSESATKRGFTIDFSYLTAFADYRIPQILCYFGLLMYNEALINAIKNGFLENSKMEIEIRAFSVVACERLRKITELPAAQIDTLLWKMRRTFGKDLDEMHPFHKYSTTAY